LKALFNTYPVAFHTPGGGEIQLLRTKEALMRLGIDVELYDQWKPKIPDADVVHYFSVFGGSSVFCNFVKDQGKPLAISSVLYPHKNVERYPMGEIRHLLSIADIVLPNSIHEGELLSRVFDLPISKFRPVYNGVDGIFLSDPGFDGSLFRKAFSIDGPFLLSVANIEERKNQIALARALSKTDFQLILFGNIRDQAYYEEMHRVSNGKIRFLGYLPNHSELLRSAYLACDAFLLPSLLETPGLAALEAAAMGAKVVVTSVGSTQEYFENLVHYVDPEDETSFLPAIESALNTPATGALKNHIRSRFTWENAARQTLAAYREILGS
jgi:glycosyltransferase involved in cell wall biosynthesis